jgi:hypothetical protein
VQVVKDLSIRDGAGRMRYFRIHRLVKVPGPGVYTGEFAEEWFPFDATPRLSRWFIPYAWQSVNDPVPGEPQNYADTPDFSQPRYIVFVDEFSSYGAMTSQAYGVVYDAETATKPGQIARQMFEINASGVILKQRSWQYTPEQTVTAGSGLGEEFIYQTIHDYFADRGTEIPCCPPWSNSPTHESADCTSPSTPTPDQLRDQRTCELL